MPRRSAAAASLPLVNHRPSRLAPPRDLDPAVLAVWRRITSSLDVRHFVAADGELLRAFCEAAVLSQEAFVELRRGGRVVGGKPSPWLIILEKSTRTLGALAPRLRLGPSARSDPKVLARRLSGPGPSIYDLMREEALDEREQQ